MLVTILANVLTNCAAQLLQLFTSLSVVETISSTYCLGVLTFAFGEEQFFAFYQAQLCP